ncbi:site-specific integrase [Marinobacter sp. 2_MG-2023]|uniref:site-specific integrase n=1 Tax=Marinobacter sp. 2_MG-2023 TaxID=3062679 RepID=UPI0026E4243C|nr:site-specific integrase [Marinobacter sp. 2_MG-2023]MDO6442092.1 site-specific integrase [Marinobacter sp. 2_MG-2023]
MKYKPASQFRIIKISHTESGERRFIVVNRETLTPMEAASIYETHLNHRYDSPGTRQQHLNSIVYLYSWAKTQAINLDKQLLSGEGLTQAQARSFAAWLRKYRIEGNGVLPYKKRRTINKILSLCSVICRWFTTQFARPDSGSTHEQVINIHILVDAQKRMWKELQTKVRQEIFAPDLSDEQIKKVEHFLLPENRHSSVGWDIATRDYLIWRMAIEFGMRIGEILAMRLQDCPGRNSPYFKIVRIEERGPDYFDPRKVPARPKTLSRQLGIQLSNTKFPNLLTDYVSTHRYIKAIHKGRNIRKFFLPHPFLLIARNGNPLSGKMADNVAHKIKEGTGVDFHWHLARHAFFNRAYSAVAEIKDRDEQQVKLADLVVWGGWQDPQSLDIYSRRARRERARTALHLWQKGGDEWNALN